MAKSDELFVLIQSLTKSEKRYFKLISNLVSGNKNYLKVFNAIEKQSRKLSGVYDEEAIIKKYKNEKFTKRFSMSKDYLYKQILKVMDMYYYADKPTLELKSILKQADFLYQKKLIGQYQKMLNRAKKIAQSYEITNANEIFPIYLEIFDRERRLLNGFPYSKNVEQQIKECFEQHERYAKKYNNLSLYLFYSAQMQFLEKKILSSSGQDRNKIMESIDRLFHEPLLKDESQALSFNAKFSFYQMYAEYHLLKKEYKRSYEFRKKIVAYVEQQQNYSEDYLSYYIPALYNFIIICCDRLKGEYDEALEAIHKLRQCLNFPDTTTQQTMVYLNTHAFELNIYLALQNEQAGLKVAKEMESLLKHPVYNTFVRDKLLIHLLLARFYFYTGKYSQALTWMNELLSNQAAKTYQDTYVAARILNLLIQFELANYDLLTYEIRSVERLLKETKKITKVEKLLFTFLNKYNAAESKQVLSKKFEQLGSQIKDKMSENQELDFFIDYYKWAKSKQEGKPIIHLQP